MKTVLVCGVDGYIGHALTLRLLEKGYRVIGVDDYTRRYNVEQMGSYSATDIDTVEERIDTYKHIGNFEFFECSIEHDFEEFEQWYADKYIPKHIHAIDTIVNLAQQPSAPFSLKSREDAVDTTVGNLIGTINVLYFMKKFCPDAHLIQIGSMGEYDHAAGVDIAEGVFDFEFQGRVAQNVIFPRRPGSFYHASKVAATYYIDCACRWWGIRATDIMQGVVYGCWTPEIELYNSPTRLDSDECFGTVVNRFCVQALIQEPLTIYGDGEQKRGYLALNDSIQCLMLAIENRAQPAEYRTWNQLDTVHTINEIAETVQRVAHEYGLDINAEHIPTPRAEKTSKFEHYNVYTDKLSKLGFSPTRILQQEVEWVFKTLSDSRDELFALQNVVNPVIKWR